MYADQRFGIGQKVKNIGPMTSRDEKKSECEKIMQFSSMEGLECSKRDENIINRKVLIFYIETVLNFLFQVRKINFRRSIEKNKHKSEHFLRTNRKSQKINGKLYEHFLLFGKFFKKHSLFIFFWSISEK